MGVIETRTLRLEPLTPAHADEMLEPLSGAALYDYMPGGPPASAAALRERYAVLARGKSADGIQRWLNWIVRLRSGQCAGFVQATIHPSHTGDFAYVLAPEYWGRGIAFEACQATLPYLAHELQVSTLYATVDPRNARSLGLLNRLGFREVPAHDYPHGEVEPADRVFSPFFKDSAPLVSPSSP